MIARATKNKKAVPAARVPTTASGRPRSRLPAKTLIAPTVHCAIGVISWNNFAGEPDMGELLDELRKQVEQVQAGDMRQVEAILYGQAMALQTLFTDIMRRTSAPSLSMKQLQTYMAIGLKAQAQCRATLEAIAEIKNPRHATFVRGQANFASGPQQVNNQSHATASVIGEPEAGPLTTSPARVDNLSDVRSKLLERSDGQRLDPGTQGAASGAHHDLETVGAVDGPADR